MSMRIVLIKTCRDLDEILIYLRVVKETLGNCSGSYLFDKTVFQIEVCSFCYLVFVVYIVDIHEGSFVFIRFLGFFSRMLHDIIHQLYEIPVLIELN